MLSGYRIVQVEYFKLNDIFHIHRVSINELRVSVSHLSVPLYFIQCDAELQHPPRAHKYNEVSIPWKNGGYPSIIVSRARLSRTSYRNLPRVIARHGLEHTRYDYLDIRNLKVESVGRQFPRLSVARNSRRENKYANIRNSRRENKYVNVR